MTDEQQKPEQGQGGDPQATAKDWRPLSDAPVTEISQPNGNVVRLDQQGRMLCKAKRRDGELCKSPAVTGMLVCRIHGASSRQSKNMRKLRLSELADPAIATLAREMAQADKSADRQRAANSILDRAGYGRHQTVSVDDAKDELYQRILEFKERSAEAAEVDAELEDAVEEVDPDEFDQVYPADDPTPDEA